MSSHRPFIENVIVNSSGNNNAWYKSSHQSYQDFSTNSFQSRGTSHEQQLSPLQSRFSQESVQYGLSQNDPSYYTQTQSSYERTRPNDSANYKESKYSNSYHYQESNAEHSRAMDENGYNQVNQTPRMQEHMQCLQISEDCRNPGQMPVEYYHNREAHMNLREDSHNPSRSMAQSVSFQNTRAASPPRHSNSHHDNLHQRDGSARQSFVSSQHQLSNQYNVSSPPPHMQQVGQPEMIKKTTNDGGEVAVFGVVAKVSPPTTLRPQPGNHQSFQEQRGAVQRLPSPHQSPVRTAHNPRTITEQQRAPSSQYAREQNSVYYDNTKPTYSERTVPDRFAQAEKTQRMEQPSYHDNSRRFGSGYNGQRDGYREEQTDSSGYGSALTERSYDSSQQQRYSQDNRRPPIPQKAHTSGLRSPSWQQHSPSQSQNAQVFLQDSYPNSSQLKGNAQHSNHEQKRAFNRVSHWTLRKPNAPHTQRQQAYRQQGPADLEVDRNQQIRGVSSVRELFEKPTSGVPLPPKSQTYGSNQYNNTKPPQAKPQFQPDTTWSSQERQPSYQPQSPTNYSPPEPPRNHQASGGFHQRPPPRSHVAPPHQQPPVQRHPDSSTQRRYEMRSHLNTQQQDDPLPSRPYQSRYPSHDNRVPDESRLGHSGRHPLPYQEPPPNHSQSMNNLDIVRPERSPLNLQSSNSQSSYIPTRPHTEESMVVGVRFEKHSNYPLGRSSQFAHEPSNFLSRNDSEAPLENLQHGSRDEPQRGYNYVEQRRSQRYEDNIPDHNHEPVRSPVDGRNHISQNFNTFNDNNSNIYQQQQRNSVSLPHSDQFNQEQFRSSNAIYKQSFDERSSSYQHEDNRRMQSPIQVNYAPRVAARNDDLFNQPGIEEQPLSRNNDWAQQPRNNSRLQQQSDLPTDSYGKQVYSSETKTIKQLHTNENSPELVQRHNNQTQYQTRQPPTGVESTRTHGQIPRHPFDPVDGDTSEGSDVETLTHPWPDQGQPTYSRSNHSGAADGENRNHLNQPRPVPAGGKHQQARRQPGDGLNDDKFLINPTNLQQQPQPAGASRPVAPRKPVRSSMKKLNKVVMPDVENASPDQQSDEPRPLNHNHALERARLAKAGRVSRKPPTRALSSGLLVQASVEISSSDDEPRTSFNDLARKQTSPISSQQPKVTSNISQGKASHPKRHIHEEHKHATNEGTQTDPPPPAEQKTKPKNKKLLFKPASKDIQKLPASYSLPDIQEPAVNDRKKPPTYTTLLNQFESARDKAFRSAAKKQDKALKAVQAVTRLSKRTPSPVKSTSPTNQEVANRRKENRSRERSSRRDRGRSRSREREISPHRLVRSLSPEERRGRSRSRDRSSSPMRRGRDRSREKRLDREDKDRKSARDRMHRTVSPYRHDGDEPPYQRSHYPRRDESPYHRHNRSDEPEWVEHLRRKKQAKEEQWNTRGNWVNDPRWRHKQESHNVEQGQNSRRPHHTDHSQPQRSQMLPSKLMARSHPVPSKRPASNNRISQRNRKY